MENRRKKGDNKMMDVLGIIVVVVVAFIAVLVVHKLIRDCGGRIERRIANLYIPSMAGRVLMLEAFMPFLRLDEEKVTKILFEAAEANNLEKLKYYLKIGVFHESEINMRDGEHRTLGHIAVRQKNKDIFDWFLRNGGKTNIPGGKGNQSVDDILRKDPEVQMWRSVNEDR